MRHYRFRGRDDILTEKPLPACRRLNENWLRSHWLWLTLLPVGALIGVFLFLQHSVVNVMHLPWTSLLLSRYPNVGLTGDVKNSKPWKRRGSTLRNVLREKNNPTIRVLLWSKPSGRVH